MRHRKLLLSRPSLRRGPAGSRPARAIVMLILPLLAATAAHAEVGGLHRVNAFMNNILLVLRGVAVSTVTIAIMWSGYRLLFRQADVLDVARVVLAGLLIGGAAEIARYLLG